MSALVMEKPQADRWDLTDVLLVPMDSLDAYFARVHAIPTLSAEEEAAWGRAVQAGDADAAIRLAVHNLRFAAHLARKWEGRSTLESVWSLADAVQAANIGLWAAVLRFDPRLARLTTYAEWWIHHAWDHARSQFRWQVRLPKHAVTEWHAYRRALRQWHQDCQSTPTQRALAETLGWPVTRVAFWQQWEATTDHPVSLDVAAVEGGDPLGVLLVDPEIESLWDHLDHVFQQRAVDELLTHLQPREADVVRLRFGITGLPLTLAEIGHLFHLTRERVRQIEAQALKKLRAATAAHPEWALHDLIR